MSSSQLVRKKGFALAATLMLIAFGTIVLLATGLQLSRTSGVLNSQRSISKTQSIANNAVEVASFYFLYDPTASSISKSTWSGLSEFKSMLDSRSGIDSLYWSEFVGDLTASTPCYDLMSYVNSHASDEGLGSGDYSLGAYVYPLGDRFATIAYAEKQGVRRYSLGLMETIGIAEGGLPALRTVSLERALQVMRNPNGNKIVGDLIYGNALIAGLLSLDITQSATPGEIVAGGVSAGQLSISPLVGTDLETYLAGFPGWYTAVNEDPYTLYENWYSEYLDSFPTEQPFTYVLDSDDYSNVVAEVSHVGEETVVIIKSNQSSPQFYGTFSSSGLRIELGDKEFTVPSAVVQENTIHIWIEDGDFTILHEKENNPHMISEVNGKYDIRVGNGDITIGTNLVYSDLKSKVNNGGNSPVANQTKATSITTIQDILKTPNNDYLRLAADGGDLILKYDRESTTGDRVLTGDFYAFANESNSVGGNVDFLDLDTISNVVSGGQYSQMFLLGSLTSRSFDENGSTLFNQENNKNKPPDIVDLLRSLVLVATGGSGGTGDPSQGSGNRLALLGIQSW
ncbi:hypothetical protein V511_00540 [Mesotoga sp. Brook.08.YT.4.2.5.1]|uniref:hypothetical protein n=1 Tax=unclassified Mesotoga TaxID=1184398 RepID=UPI000C1922BC|nr:MULTISPECIES: hypothetical protein [unclassified Mesotoga]PNE23703.1 hypothetical protein V511_00540 [Mesotoga sp. Brook.08.YT.4.2.5.1]PVD16525.1 hypothetical protein V512_006245 [Mesotoga sp. Brook.08.105.5.1]RAO97641.1 hypothetical protein M388_10125 [Mesotoga sp. Brook.08.YT.4.2.5.4.]RDI93215.1 hypothetical protein Q502_07140 [Mesotoga sp. Brook.08.YT.4.2.5.2.]